MSPENELYMNLLGNPEIYIDTPPSLRFRTRKAQALLIYLEVTNKRCTRDALATLFWPETTDERARKNLRDILPTLRRHVSDYLLFDEETIAINSSSQIKCDVSRFRSALEKPLHLIEIDALTETLALYRGEFLEGYRIEKISTDFEEWALREREQLQALALRGLSELCHHRQALGDYESALTTNKRILDLAPWDETAHRQQMMLLAQSGQQTAALAYFETCRQILADELDVEPESTTVELFEKIKAGKILTNANPTSTNLTRETGAAAHLLQPQKPKSIPHNLPRQLTSLIGREDDIDAVLRQIHEENTALVTLVGQGGVGKTRLAQAVGQKLQKSAHEQVPDGIWFVPLAGIAGRVDAKEEMASAIAQALGLKLSGSDPLSTQLIRALEAQKLLLILDNFEHLVTEQAFLLEIVQSAHAVKVLVTSREQLHLHAEFLYSVTGLPVPTNRDLTTAQEESSLFDLDHDRERISSPPNELSKDLKQYSSVQLFVTRVQQRLPEFQLTTQNQSNIGLLCRLLGGVPLGIELAAQLYVEQGATVLSQLIEEIEQLDPLVAQSHDDSLALDHLQTKAIDLPERQRSIRAVFSYSWRLLNEAEQKLLCHSAIFRGGFDREAILTVGNGDGATLLSLVMKSLLKRDSHDRYDIHELVRQYVIAEFQRTPTDVHTAAQKHAAYFTNLLAGQEERLFQQAAFHQIIRTEIYNIRAAWHWLAQQAPMDKEQVHLLDSCITCLFEFFFLAEQYQDASALAQQSIRPVRQFSEQGQQSSTATRLLGHLLNYAARAGLHIGQVTVAKEWLQEARQIAQKIDDAMLMAQVCLTLRFTDVITSDFVGEMIDAAIGWAKRAERPFLQAMAHLEAVTYWCWDSPDSVSKASESWEAAMDLIQTNNYKFIEGYALITRQIVYDALDEWEAALETLELGLACCQTYGSTLGTIQAHVHLGFIYQYLGNYAGALRWSTLSYKQSKMCGYLRGVRANIHNMGIAETHLGNWQNAERYFREAIEVSESLDGVFGQLCGYLELGYLFNKQGRYAESEAYYQKAMQLTPAVDFPEFKALIRSQLALVYLQQDKPNQALLEVEELLAEHEIFAFRLLDATSVASKTYQVLDAHNDPRAPQILEQAHGLVQTHGAKIKDRNLRASFLENIPEHRELITFWETRNDKSKRVEKRPNADFSQEADSSAIFNIP